ncbi:MAG TPA: GNAT family N-acetyltransferase [Flavisolibacter sp.]
MQSMMRTYTYRDGLQSERLRTRFLGPGDVIPWSEFFRDEEALEFFPMIEGNTPEEKSQWWIDRQMARYRENRFGLQALHHRETNELIGQCGLLLQVVDGVEEVEVGYDILRPYRCQGYAAEAAKLFIDKAFQNLADSVISLIDPRNIPSQRVAGKNGLSKEKLTIWSDCLLFVYRITREQWSR